MNEADCAEGKTCEAGVCMAVDTSNTGIAQENAGIDFANLFVGESYKILAPEPVEIPGDSIPSPDTRDGPPANATPQRPAPPVLKQSH